MPTARPEVITCAQLAAWLSDTRPGFDASPIGVTANDRTHNPRSHPSQHSAAPLAQHGEIRTTGHPIDSILHDMQPAPRCAICGDAIGVYEPLLAIDRDSARPASLAREPDLGDLARSSYTATAPPPNGR